MTLQEIKNAVEAGKTVHWSNEGYCVIKGKRSQEWLIVWQLGTLQENCIGLTWRDGVTMNGKEKDFYIAE
jgi:hypothetical protein